MAKLKRAISVSQLERKKRTIIDFDGIWARHIGLPERTGSFIVYGHSGNGKTSYCVQLARYLCKFGNVLYDGLEEGDSESFRIACHRVGMRDVSSMFKVVDDEYDNLVVRLKMRGSADYIFIDSLQMAEISFARYKRLKEMFPRKLFIYISHADGKKPEGRTGKKIEYFSAVKIWVEGYKAFVKSRYGGTEPYVIYPERSAEYWSDITTSPPTPLLQRGEQ